MITYDIAISFAGEDRDVAKNLVRCLKKKGLSVFYDFDFQYDLVGKDLYQHLHKIYKDSALFFIPIISKNYINKPWAMHELKAAQEREFSSNSEYILPIKLDDTPVPGIPITKGNLDLNQLSVAKISTIIKKKVDEQKNNNSTFYEQKRLYSEIMHSFEFVLNRFCLLSQISKVAEFTHLITMIQQYKDTFRQMKYKLNLSFYKIILDLLEHMEVEEDEHLNGSDEKALFNKQLKLMGLFIGFKQVYACFAKNRYSKTFDFFYYIKSHKIYADTELTNKALKELAKISKREVVKPITATELYHEYLKIYLLDNLNTTEEKDIDKLISIFPEELLNDFDNSPRINQEAFDKIKTIIGANS